MRSITWLSPEPRLIPSDYPLRRRVVEPAAIALACAEKARSGRSMRGRVRPAEKVHTPWIEHNDKQVLAGFEHLELGSGGDRWYGKWIAGMPQHKKLM